MCYAHPGPRCSGHARKRLQHLTQKESVLTAAIADASAVAAEKAAAREAATDPKERRLHAREEKAALRDVKRLTAQREKAEEKVAESELAFDSTPQGQKNLKALVDENSDNPAEVAKLKARIAAGVELRNTQVTEMNKKTAAKVLEKKPVPTKADYHISPRNDVSPANSEYKASTIDDSRNSAVKGYVADAGDVGGDIQLGPAHSIKFDTFDGHVTVYAYTVACDADGKPLDYSQADNAAQYCYQIQQEHVSYDEDGNESASDSDDGSFIINPYSEDDLEDEWNSMGGETEYFYTNSDLFADHDEANGAAESYVKGLKLKDLIKK
jgi:hypothetical protein